MTGGWDWRKRPREDAAHLCDKLPVFPPVPESSSEEEEEEDEEEAGGYGLGSHNRLSPPALDESGLGLLARFAASAMPSPLIPPMLSIVQLEAKQKAKKKEERQSLMGKEGPDGVVVWEADLGP